jgi:pimeloyl-ACP methyl ester carboxylesterase
MNVRAACSAGRRGWNGRVCGWARILGNIGINSNIESDLFRDTAMQKPSLAQTESRRFSLPMRYVVIVTAAVAMVLGGWMGPFAGSAFGQEQKAVKKADKKDGDEVELPEPVDALVSTRDGVQLTLTYYASTKGIQSVPVVLLHGWKRSRNEYKAIAASLQSQGYAVIIPDLRGHGDSTRRKVGGREDTFNAALMSPAQFSAMVTEDMKAVKKFLWKRNNARELNIDKLCVVGEEMGASVALNFAHFDAVGYETGTPLYGNLKLGRFVKALVLISPAWSFRGLPLSDAMRDPTVQSDIAVLFLVGKQDPKAMDDAKRLYNLFEKWHPEPVTNDKDEKLAKQTLFFGKLDTNLQGDKLLDSRFHVQDIIANFLSLRLVKSDESKTWTWKERKWPYEN